LIRKKHHASINNEFIFEKLKFSGINLGVDKDFMQSIDINDINEDYIAKK